MATQKTNGQGQSQMNAWAVAMNFAYGVVGSVLLGLLIDWLAGTLPLFTLILMLGGLIGAGYRFVKDALAMGKPPSRGGQAEGRDSAADGASGGGSAGDRERRK